MSRRHIIEVVVEFDQVKDIVDETGCGGKRGRSYLALSPTLLIAGRCDAYVGHLGLRNSPASCLLRATCIYEVIAVSDDTLLTTPLPFILSIKLNGRQLQPDHLCTESHLHRTHTRNVKSGLAYIHI